MPSSPSSPILRLDGICHRFAQGTVFSGFSADIGSGLTLLCGGESQGKTTLLRIIAGDLVPDAGTVSLDGIVPGRSSDAWHKQVFWVNPRTESFNAITTVEYIETLTRVHARMDVAHVLELADSLGLSPHIDKPLYMLSTGSRRKVFLAAAFGAGATVTLLDEPFAALDGPSMARVRQLLRDAAALSGRAWVIADYEAPAGVPLASTIDLGD
jgi:ABC-type multidrug transport system ATPase subunit